MAWTTFNGQAKRGLLEAVREGCVFRGSGFSHPTHRAFPPQNLVCKSTFRAQTAHPRHCRLPRRGRQTIKSNEGTGRNRRRETPAVCCPRKPGSLAQFEIPGPPPNTSAELLTRESLRDDTNEAREPASSQFL